MSDGETTHLETLAQVLADVAAGRFDARLPRSGAGDAQDVVAFLVNNMAAEVGALVEGATRSEARYRRLFEESPVAKLLVLRGGLVVDANRAAALMYGRTAAELIGTDLRALHREEFRDVFAAVLATHPAPDDRLAPFEAKSVRPDGAMVCVEFSASWQDMGDDRALLLVGRDVTEKHAAALELDRARKELEHSRRMEAVGTLAGGIAHDFNNLLTIILTAAALMGDEVDMRGEAAEDLSSIQHAAERGAALVRQLLVMSRGVRGETRTTSLVALLHPMQRLLAALAGDTIELRLTVDRDLPEVDIDPVGVERVVVNLVSNAIRAMPRGGEVCIRARVVSEGESLPVELQRDRYVCLQVSDTGVGMTEEMLERIFEPFFTTRPVGEGTGLGLSAAHGIIRELGGTISASSALGQGSVFRVFLPVATVRHSQEPTEPEHNEDALKGLHVLLVDDEESIRKLVQRSLERRGLSVQVFATPAEALSFMSSFEARGPGRAPDLLISDVKMPGMLGPELACRLRERWPELPVLFITGDGGSELRARDLGPHRMLSKPFRPRALLGALRELLLG